MGIMYIAGIDSVSMTTSSKDLWSLGAGANNKIILHGWEVTSDAIAAALLEVKLQRWTTTGSTAGTALTETPLNQLEAPTSNSTAHAGFTTGGTTTTLLQGFQWEQLGPLGMVYTPEMRPVIDVSEGVALNCAATTAFEMSGWICWEEL